MEQKDYDQCEGLILEYLRTFPCPITPQRLFEIIKLHGAFPPAMAICYNRLLNRGVINYDSNYQLYIC